MPILSIIMPVYNMARCGILSRAIESVLNQTFRDYELIIINDGSTDDSALIIDEYAARDSRITAIHKKNDGCYRAYNDGLDLAKGDYITFFNSDDYADPEMYEELCGRCRTHQLDYLLMSLWYDQCDEKGIVIQSEQITEIDRDLLYEKSEFRRTYELYKTFKPHNVHIYRRQLIGDLRFQARHYGEDCIFNLHFVPRVERALYCATPFYHHCEYGSERYNASINKFDPNMNLLFSERFLLAKKNMLGWGVYEGENRHIVARRRMDDLLLQYRLFDSPSCQISCEEKRQLARSWIDDAVVEAACDLLEDRTLVDVLLRAKHRQLDGGNPANIAFEGVMAGKLAVAVPQLCSKLEKTGACNPIAVRNAFMDAIGAYM